MAVSKQYRHASNLLGGRAVDPSWDDWTMIREYFESAAACWEAGRDGTFHETRALEMLVDYLHAPVDQITYSIAPFGYAKTLTIRS